MPYEYKSGFQARAVKAEVAAAELERIKIENGALTADGVFEAARPKVAPLHGEFEWDGKKAIHELGLIRARQIIRAVVIVRPEEEKPPQRVWVHVANEKNPREPGEYEKLEVVVQQVDLWTRAIEGLQRKFSAAEEALMEVRRAGEESQDAERLAAISLAVQGFGAVREALALLAR